MSQNHPEEFAVLRSIALGDTGTTTTTSNTLVTGWVITNTNAAIRYIKLYNKATAASGSDTPVLTLLVPASSTITFSIPGGISFPLGLSVRGVTGIADNNTTGNTSGDVYTQIFYKVR